MANGVLDDNLIENGTIVERDEESVADASLLGIMVVHAECLVLDTVNLSTERIDTRIRCGGVSAEG